MSQLVLGLHRCRPRMRLPIKQPKTCMVVVMSRRTFKDKKSRRPPLTIDNQKGRPFTFDDRRYRLETLKRNLASPLGIGPGVGELPTLKELTVDKKSAEKMKIQRRRDLNNMLVKQQKFTQASTTGIMRLSIMVIGQFIGPGSIAISDVLKYLNRLQFGSRDRWGMQYGTTWQLPATLGPRVAAQLDKYTRRVVEMRMSVLTDLGCQYVAFALTRPYVPGLLPEATRTRLDHVLYGLNREDRAMRKSLHLQTEVLRVFGATLAHYERVVAQIWEKGPKEARNYDIYDVPQFLEAAARIRRGMELARESAILSAEQQMRKWDLNFDAVNLKYHTLRNRWVASGLLRGQTMLRAPQKIGEYFDLDSMPRYPGAFAPDWRLSIYRE